MSDIKEILIASQVSKVGSQRPGSTGKANASKPSVSFDQALQAEELKISKHAQKRLDARSISLTQNDHARLNEALSSLEQKGARDSLVLMGELALVVNVPSKTVVTAIQREQMQEQVFTNIDSTILVNR